MIRIITFRLLCLDTCLLGLFFCTSFQTTFQCSKIIWITLFFLIFNCLCEDLRERWAPARSGSNSSSLLMRQSPPTSCLQVWSHLSFCCQAEHFNKVYQNRLTFVASLMWTLAELQLFVFILFSKQHVLPRTKGDPVTNTKLQFPSVSSHKGDNFHSCGVSQTWKLYSLYSENTKSVQCGSVFPVLQFFFFVTGRVILRNVCISTKQKILITPSMHFNRNSISVMV